MPSSSRDVRPRRLILLAAVLVALATCSSLDNFALDVEAETVVPQRSVLDEILGQLSFAGFEGLDITETQEFRNQGYTRDQVDSVRIVEMVLSIRAPADANFDWLTRLAFSIEADGLDPVEIARIDPVPDGASELVLEVDSDIELAPYVLAETMTITTQATGIRPPEETTVAARVLFDIDVNVDGSAGCN